MIGQEKNIREFKKWDNLPALTLIIGQQGSGKKTLANAIFDHFNYHLITVGLSVEEIRNAIDVSYRVAAPTIYYIPDCDRMHIIAKNALLKVIEEPPQQAYFILTISDQHQTLETIRSRANIIRMQPYRYCEIDELYDQEGIAGNKDLIVEICRLPGDLLKWKEGNFDEFWNYCNLVVDKIHTAPVGNVLKIAQKLKYKEEEEKEQAEKYDPVMFLNCLSNIISGIEGGAGQAAIVYKMVKRVSSAKRALGINGINKQFMIEQMLIDLIFLRRRYAELQHLNKNNRPA